MSLQPLGPAAAAAADGSKNPGQPGAMDVDVNDDWAALTKDGDQQDEPAADADAAAAVKPEAAAAGAAAGAIARLEQM